MVNLVVSSWYCDMLLSGHAVKRLTQHSDKAVCQLARQVISSWKNHFEEKLSRPALDVRCDHATTESRQTVRKHIGTALLIDNELEQSLVSCASHGHVTNVCLSVCLSHAGIVPSQMKTESRGPHYEVANSL